MDDKSAEIIGLFLNYVVGGLVLGFLAARKNRSYWAWGLIGGLAWVPCLIALVLLPHLCPRCERPLTDSEWRRGACPTCRTPDQAKPSA